MLNPFQYSNKEDNLVKPEEQIKEEGGEEGEYYEEEGYYYGDEVQPAGEGGDEDEEAAEVKWKHIENDRWSENKMSANCKIII